MNSFKINFNKDILNLKWHENTYPELNSVVICHINKIDKYGINVDILDYGIEGYLTTKELSRRKIRSIGSIMNVGDIRPLIVIKVDITGDRVIIDLSNKQLDDPNYDIDILEKYYRLITMIHTWLKNIYNESEIKSKQFAPYDANDWIKIMKLTLWTESIDDIYLKFMNIKLKISNINETFELLSNQINTSSLDTILDIKPKHLDQLSDLIDNYINYEIIIKINLRLNCWSLNAIGTLKEILNNLSLIPKDVFQSQFIFDQIIINSPNYEFTIKSSNKLLMDQIFDLSIVMNESKLYKTFDQILKIISDIEYHIDILRNDIY